MYWTRRHSSPTASKMCSTAASMIGRCPFSFEDSGTGRAGICTFLRTANNTLHEVGNEEAAPALLPPVWVEEVQMQLLQRISARNMYNLLKRADPSSFTGDRQILLRDITKACSKFMMYSPGPHRFIVSVPKSKVVFNSTLALDWMFLEGNAVLHVVDTATGFGSAVFLQGRSTARVYGTSRECFPIVLGLHVSWALR